MIEVLCGRREGEGGGGGGGGRVRERVKNDRPDKKLNTTH